MKNITFTKAEVEFEGGELCSVNGRSITIVVGDDGYNVYTNSDGQLVSGPCRSQQVAELKAIEGMSK